MDWEESEAQLEEMKQCFVVMHDIGEKNWSPEEKELVRVLRKRCIQLGEIRYKLARKRYERISK